MFMLSPAPHFGAVVLIGDSGVGKSNLLSRFTRWVLLNSLPRRIGSGSLALSTPRELLRRPGLQCGSASLGSGAPRSI